MFARKKQIIDKLDIKKIITLMFIITVLLILSYYFPIVGDDWADLMENISTPKRLGAQIYREWSSLNGRVLGNTLALVFGHYKILRAIVKSIMTFLIIVFVSKNSNFKKYDEYLFAFIFILALPSPFFRQTYAWSAGFFNYVVPVMVIIIYTYVVRNIFVGTEIQGSVPKVILCILLGICSQLFVENITIYTIIMAATLFIVDKVINKKTSKLTASYLIGTIIGAWIMFTSPVYGSLANKSDGYRTLPNSIAGLIDVFRDNYQEFSKCLISNNYILLISLSIGIITLIIIYGKSNNKKINYLRIINIAIILGIDVYYVCSTKFFSEYFNIAGSLKAMLLDVLICGIFFMVVLVSLIIFIKDKLYRNKSIFFWISAFLSVGPMLFVKPIGPRCFYISYIFMVIVLCLIKGYINSNKGNSNNNIFKISLVLISIFISIYYVRIYNQIHIIETERNVYIEECMNAKETEIYVPRFDYDKHIHEPEDDKISKKYNYNKAGDIKFIYISYNDWKEQYYKK